MWNKFKILIILGPTATGKSQLAVRLAKKYRGEIISADSRQVYKGLDVGTGKITKKEKRGVSHHMLDVVSSKKVFSVFGWQKQTKKIILDIISRDKLPIICGGTGFYIQSIVDSVVLPKVPPNKKLRKLLEKKDAAELFSILKKLDPKRAENIEKENPARLIRAIEITTSLGKVMKIKKQKSPYDILQIGLILSSKELKSKIHKRLLYRMKKGMVREAQNLHKNGLSFKRMRQLGLEYGYLADYIENKISKLELAENIERGNLQYAKRQMTWFKRDKKIKWFKPTNINKINKEIKRFLLKS